MSIDPLSVVLGHIEYLVVSLQKKPNKISTHDFIENVNQTVQFWGREAEVHLFRSLLSSTDFSVDSRGQPKESIQAQLIEKLFTTFAVVKPKPGFLSSFCEGYDRPLRPLRVSSLAQFCRTCRFSPAADVVFGLALLNSVNQETRKAAKEYLFQVLPILFRSYADPDIAKDTGLQDCAVETVHFILTSLQEDSEEFGVKNSDLKEGFIATLKRDFPAEGVPVLLLPWLSSGQSDFAMDLNRDRMDLPTNLAHSTTTGLPQQIQEIGYAFTANMESCKHHLMALGAQDGSVLKAASVARILTMMIQSHTGLRGGVPVIQVQPGWADKSKGAASDWATEWNSKLFARIVNEMVPNFNWSEVIVQLDQPGFYVRDRKGLILLTDCLLEGLGQNVFPVALLYREWNFHKDGHLSWILQILHNSDVFCFFDFPHRLVHTEVLKAPPEDTNKESANWKSLDLMDILLKLSDAPGLYGDAMNAFKYPIQHCPDVLTLGLLQIQPPMSSLRQELLKTIMPIFLGNHPNSSVILNYTWNSNLHNQQVLQNIVLQAMVQYYMKNPDDQSRLSRILEVAHDLKPQGLTMLFNVPKFSFALDLACLASRRDYLKLDTWVSNKIRDQGEPFVIECIDFLKRKGPPVFGGPPGATLLPTDVFTAILYCLHGLSSSFSETVSKEIQKMVATCQHAMVRSSTPSAPVSMAPGPAVSMPISNLDNTVALKNNPSLTNLSSATPFGAPPLRSNMPGPMDLFNSIGTRGSATGFPGRFESPGFGFGSSTSTTPYLGGTGSGSMSDFLSGVSSSSHTIGQLGTHSSIATPPLMMGSQQSISPARGMFQQQQPSQFARTLSNWGAPSQPTAIDTIRPQPSGLGTVAAGYGTGMAPPSQPSGTDPGAPDITQSFPEDVQDEANSYFQQIYTQPPQPCMSISEFLKKLKSFSTSPNEKEKQVFACMLKNLFDEYRFFPEYPDRELYTTALVFGGIIRENIISGIMLAAAMRYIMQALSSEHASKPPEHGTKMFNFGVVALNECKNRLKDYPRMSMYISQLPNYSNLPQALVEYVDTGRSGQLPANAVADTSTSNISNIPSNWQQLAIKHSQQTSASSSTPVSSAATADQSAAALAAAAAKAKAPSLPTSTNISILVSGQTQVEQPPERIEEKVAFLFNNLSQANLTKKTEEMQSVFLDGEKDYLPWLAQYLVMKRISIEPNFHHLYCNFLTAIADKRFDELVLGETYRDIKIVLKSDKRQAVSNFSDRQLLKNLGHWLGMITIGKNKAIMHSDLDLKSLLMEAYYKGQQELLYVVPFVAKIMEASGKSKIFQSDCAWAMAILKILVELHREPDLKLNLKFEIEVLCKSLIVDLRNLGIDNVLKDTERLLRVTQQLDDLAELKQPLSELASGSVVAPSPVPNSAHLLTSKVNESVDQPTAAHEEGSAQAAAAPSGSTPPPARFSYHDINVTSFAGLAPHLRINPSLPLFQMNPPLKNLVRPALEHAVRELISPVTDRGIKVAMTTTEHVVKKDYSLESDESKMRAAAHHMMRSLTAGMAMITCREPLVITLQGYLKQAFYTTLRGANPEQQKMIEEAALAIAEDNVELAQGFIVKTACEKGTPEIDKRMDYEYSIRQRAKVENRRHVDPTALALNETLPEPIRLKVGSVTTGQQSVYEEFSSNISGFKPTTEDDMIVGFPGAQPVARTGQTTAAAPTAPVGTHEKDIETMYNQLIREIDGVVNPAAVQVSKGAATLLSIRDALTAASQTPRDAISTQNLIQKLVELMLHGYHTQAPQSPEAEWVEKVRNAFLLAIRVVAGAFGSGWLTKTVTKVLIDCRQEYRYNLEAIDVFIRNSLISMVTYDLQLANSMENGLNFGAVQFAQRVAKLYFIEQPCNEVTQTDLSHTIEMLSRICNSTMQQRTSTTEGQMDEVLDLIRSGTSRAGPTQTVSVPTSTDMTPFLGGQSAFAQARGFGAIGSGAVAPPSIPAPMHVPGVRLPSEDDPPDLQQKVEFILREWINLCYSAQCMRDPSQALASIVNLMHEHGVLRTDDLITRFFRLSTEMCVDLTYRVLQKHPQEPQQVVRARCFYTLDAYVKLATLMIKYSDGRNIKTKINLLKKILSILTTVLQQDHDSRRAEFHQLPYHRILIQMFWELTTPDQLLDKMTWDILDAFGHALFVLQPRHAPGFAYAWLEIVGHRTFIGRMLAIPPMGKAWAMYTQLIICHLKFLSPFLRNIDLPKPIAMMYKGTLRVLLVLLHDFPELLCDYHYQICDAIPPNCVQLRNLVLSAYPRNMRLPDPFMPNLKVDQLPEINQSPKISVNLTQIIPVQLKTDLDLYLQNRTPVSFLSDLRSQLQVSQANGNKYNVAVMNAVVLYVGMQAIENLQMKSQRVTMSTIAHTAWMDIFQNLAVSLDTEGRYLFFNAIANQLRYPNSHTHYFSCTLLYLFLEANSEVIQEQITRILFERLVALRPHPWGLLITFIELIKNQQFGFWKHEFTRCAPEIERLFQSVASSCMSNRQPTEPPQT